MASPITRLQQYAGVVEYDLCTVEYLLDRSPEDERLWADHDELMEAREDVRQAVAYHQAWAKSLPEIRRRQLVSSLTARLGIA